MKTIIFIPAVWSKKSTPLSMREYIWPSESVCGCKDEIIGVFKEQGFKGTLVFKTLEGKNYGGD